MGSLTVGVSSSTAKVTCSDDERSSEPCEVMGVKTAAESSFFRAAESSLFRNNTGGLAGIGGNLFSGVGRTAGGGGGGVGVGPLRGYR